MQDEAKDRVRMASEEVERILRRYNVYLDSDDDEILVCADEPITAGPENKSGHICHSCTIG